MPFPPCLGFCSKVCSPSRKNGSNPRLFTQTHAQLLTKNLKLQPIMNALGIFLVMQVQRLLPWSPNHVFKKSHNLHLALEFVLLVGCFSRDCSNMTVTKRKGCLGTSFKGMLCCQHLKCPHLWHFLGPTNSNTLQSLPVTGTMVQQQWEMLSQRGPQQANRVPCIAENHADGLPFINTGLKMSGLKGL